MTIAKKFQKLLPAVVLAAAVAAPVAAGAAPASSNRDCFFVNQWRGWSAPTPDVLLLRVNMRDVYRVDLSAGSSRLQSPGVHLISKVRGSSSICSAIDLDLAVSDTLGFDTPLIARSLRKLTPEEVAALPKKDRP